MADPAPTPANDDEDGSTVIRLPRGKNAVDSDPEVIAARKARAIAEAKLAEKKANDEIKKLGKEKDPLTKKTEHAEKVGKYYKAVNEEHEAKAKHKGHTDWTTRGLIFCGVVVTLIAVAAIVMYNYHGGGVYAPVRPRCYYYDRNFGCIGKAQYVFWFIVSAVAAVAVILAALGGPGFATRAFKGKKEGGGGHKPH